MDKKYFIGKHTRIGNDVKIGENSKIWHFCNLYGCQIGNNTQIGSYCEIKEGVTIGNNCRLQAYIFIPSKTDIGNYVFIGPGVTFLNDKYPTAEKTIKRTFKIDPVIVEDYVTIGGKSTILPGIKIGRHAFIGAGSVVTKNIPEYAVVCGNPARIIGDVRDEKYLENCKFKNKGKNNG